MNNHLVWHDFGSYFYVGPFKNDINGVNDIYYD